MIRTKSPHARRPAPRLAASKPEPKAALPSPPSPPRNLEFDSIADTHMLHDLSALDRPARALERSAGRSIAEARGYAKDDLQAIAEMGYHYLRCGGYRLAMVIFDGLAAIEPNEPYHSLALGLAADHLGDKQEAARCYALAAKLDPKDGRAEINLAELSIESGDRGRARQLLSSGARKARGQGDSALERKAEALLALISTTTEREVRR